VAVYLLIALGTYTVADSTWFMSHGDAINPAIQNKGGAIGARLGDALFFLFGYMAWVFPPVMIYFTGYLLFNTRIQREKKQLFTKQRWTVLTVGFVLMLVAGCGLARLHFAVADNVLPIASAGGLLGNFVGINLWSGLQMMGATLLLLPLFLVGVTLLTGLSWLVLMDWLGVRVYQLCGRTNTFLQDKASAFASRRRERRAMRRVVVTTQEDREKGKEAKKRRADRVKQDKKRNLTRIQPRIEPKLAQEDVGERVAVERQVELFEEPVPGGLPPLNLLDDRPAHYTGYSKDALDAMTKQVEIKLQDFGVEVQVMSVHTGPVITRFELKPAPGVKGSQIANLAKDLARSMSKVSVRVVEVIPGKPYIGLEVPNEEREIVALRDVLESKEYDESPSPITMALGKDISGRSTVADLGKMPHLLVAGTTGAGKSVAVNVMLLSMLYKASPDEVRLILVDPKMLELSIYDGIPHLLTPVVTDMKDAAIALRWSVAEMERRYKLMSALGVRNMAGYNRKVKEAAAAGRPLADPLYVPHVSPLPDVEPDPIPVLEPLPYLVIVIDELSDLMLVVGKKVEELILRLAQKARAAGIHLILATQRPSVDVITGLIRANIPTRIAFQVASKIDSRTILDQMGAEQLLGKGDMLYLPITSPLPSRIHGAFVDDHEVHNVVNYLKKTGKPNYDDSVLSARDEAENGAADAGAMPSEHDDESDPLYDQAVRIVTETRRASISGVQRRLRVGYNRAARLVEQMERSGIVGELQPNGNREVIAPAPPAD